MEFRHILHEQAERDSEVKGSYAHSYRRGGHALRAPGWEGERRLSLHCDPDPAFDFLKRRGKPAASRGA